MERWNELIAGYVLGNLTEEEQAELSAVLDENPHLKLDIARLRKTATMSHVQRLNRSLERLQAGSEGWADTAHGSPILEPEDFFAHPFSAQLSQSAQPSQPAQPPVPSAPSAVDADDKSGPSDGWQRVKLPFVKMFWQRTSWFGWLVALLLVTVSLDNWRMRRMLAIAQERITELELATEVQQQ